MTNIYFTTFTLYAGDAIMIASLITGALALIALIVTRSRKLLVLDLPTESLRNFAIFQILWLMCAIIMFKAIVKQGGPTIPFSNGPHGVLTGDHGSVQVSTAGEAVAFALMLFGMYRWGRWIVVTMRRVMA